MAKKYVVNIESQYFEYDKRSEAEAKAQELLTAGLWYLQCKELKK